MSLSTVESKIRNPRGETEMPAMEVRRMVWRAEDGEDGGRWFSLEYFSAVLEMDRWENLSVLLFPSLLHVVLKWGVFFVGVKEIWKA